VKARSAGVCEAKAKLQAGARQRITSPGRRVGPVRSRGAIPFDAMAAALPWLALLAVEDSRDYACGMARSCPPLPSSDQASAWAEENARAIEAANAWVEANGLPLAALRLF